MSRDSLVFQLAENLAMIRFQLGLRENLSPDMRCGEKGVGLRGSAMADLQRTGIRIVAFEVRGINFDFMDFAGHAELEDHPIMPGAASPLGFPSIAHVFRFVGHEQIAWLAEELVARSKDDSAVLHADEIDFPSFHSLRVWHNFAVQAEPGDTAVGI